MKISALRTLPPELKREIFSVLTDQIRRRLEKRYLSEEEITADFESWRKRKRKPRGG